MILEFVPSLKRNVKITLIKLLISFIMLIIFFVALLSTENAGSVNVFLLLLTIIIFASTMLFSRDASRLLRLETPYNKSIMRLALILAIPQIFLGVMLIALGLVLPFVELYNVIQDIQSGGLFFLHFLYMINALLILLLGYFIVRQGIGSQAYVESGVKKLVKRSMKNRSGGN
jgi:hypothetical protein